MPLKKSSAPPKAMTWGKALPVLVIAILFDALRLFFEFFWFFGPALAAIGCTVGVTNFFGVSIAGTIGKVVATGCALAAGAVGTVSLEVTGTFGTVMAMAVGFLGWLIIGGIILSSNGRVFKENGLWFVASLLVSEVPIIGAFPAFTVSVWRIYSRQIKLERAALHAWHMENAQALLQEQNRQQAMQIMQAQAMQQVQFEQQEAANDAIYEQEQASNADEFGAGEEETPSNIVRFPSKGMRPPTVGETPSEMKNAA